MNAAILPFAPPTQREDERARSLSSQLAEASAQEILQRTLTNEFINEIALVSSFGAESAVLLHLAAQVSPDVPVIFLDTGKHFAQTLSYRRKLASQLGLTNVRDIHPDGEDLQIEDRGGDLFRRDANACCDVRKVRPLRGALDGFSAWVTGRKAFQGGDRVHLPAVEWNGRHFKVNPIVRWTRDDLASYMADHSLPTHPLVGQGFPSIGCWPCTRAVADGEDSRAGRWSDSVKTECGIHID